MLKWKRVSVIAAAYTEKVEHILAGASGKNRVIKYITIEDKIATDWLRVYRDADQIVDLQGTILTDTATLLPMDLPLAEGQMCSVGLYNTTAAPVTREITIGYEEAG